MTLDLAKLRADTLALIHGTTPGPWHQANGSEIHDRSVRFGAQGERLGDTPMLIAEAYAPRADVNARLIAAAPTLAADNLRLVDEIERLTAENERMRAERDAAWQAAPVYREALVEVIRASAGRTMGENVVIGEAGEIADALLARGLCLPAPETMAWAVAGEDGALTAINYDRRTARHLCGSGERVVRVAIRVVDDEVDAEVIADAPLVATDVKPRNLVAQVKIGGGAVMSIPDPRAFEDGGLEWCLRYTCPDLPNNVQFQAASAVESYDYLLGPDITMKEAIDRLRIMRRARTALAAMDTPKGGGDE